MYTIKEIFDEDSEEKNTFKLLAILYHLGAIQQGIIIQQLKFRINTLILMIIKQVFMLYNIEYKSIYICTLIFEKKLLK